MITLFNVGDKVEIRFKCKINDITIGPNGSGKSKIAYGVVYAEPDGYRHHVSISEDELLKLTGVEENEDESKT